MALTDYYLQAWTLPSAATFEPVVAQVPFERFSFGEGLNTIENNFLSMGAGFDRLLEILDPANEVETLIRCFKRDGSEVGNFLCKDVYRKYADNSETRLSGPHVSDEFRRAIVYPYDWVNDQTEVKSPDWEWGAPNRFLTNGDLEEGDEASTGWESGGMEGWEATPNSPGTWNDPDSVEVIDDGNARTGSYAVKLNADVAHSGIRKQFTVTGGSRITGSIWIKSATTGRRATLVITVKSGYTNHQANARYWQGFLIHELGNVAYQAGATTGVYQQISFDVTLASDQENFYIAIYDDEHGGGDGPIYYIDDFTISGGSIGFEPWVARNSTLTLETTNVRQGTYSLDVVTDGSGVDTDGVDYGDVVDGLTIGQTYTLTFWVQHAHGVAVNFRALIKDDNSDAWLQSTQVSVPTGLGSWTRVSTEWVATQTAVRLELRVGLAAAVTFYMDTVTFATGLAPTTLGDILQLLLAPMQTRSVLDWVKIDGFDITNDSSSTAWSNSEVSVRVNRGRNFKQVLDLLADFGLEWDLIWNSGTSEYELRCFDQGNSGTDKTATDEGQIMPGTGFLDATLLRGSPGANRILAEGENFAFAEQTDAGRETAYGRRESYKGDTSYMSNPVDVAAQHMKDQFVRQEVRARFTDIDNKDQWDKYQVGDLFGVKLKPDIDEDLRIFSKRITADRETVVVSANLLRPEV